MALIKCKCGTSFPQYNLVDTKCGNCKIEASKRKKSSKSSCLKVRKTKSEQDLNVNSIQGYSNKTIPQLKNIAERHFNTYIKLRDTDDNGCGRCISSGQPLIYSSKKAQAGHFYSGGKYPNLKFNEDNVHLQGMSDNYYNGANLLAYRKNLIKKIGIERVEALERLADHYDRNGYKWDRFFLIEVIEKYKRLNKELKKDKVK